MTMTREDPKFWDIRTLERRVRKGIVTKKEIEKHVKGLDDSAGRVAPREEDDAETEA